MDRPKQYLTLPSKYFELNINIVNGGQISNGNFYIGCWVLLAS